MFKANNETKKKQDMAVGRQSHTSRMLRLSAMDKCQASTLRERHFQPPRYTSRMLGTSILFPQPEAPHKYYYFSDTSSVTAQFTPVLRVYITADYQSTAIIQAQITSPMVWSKNLATLGDSSSWVLTSDQAGVYHIEGA